MFTRVLLASLVVVLLACKEKNGQRSLDAAGGTVVISSGADADFLLPLLTTTIVGNQIGDIIFERLAEPGDRMNTIGDAGFTPELAERWSWGADSLSLAFHLNPRARWHDGKPVSARDVKFTFDVFRDTVVGSPHTPLLAKIDSVSVRDSLTPVFWYRRRYPEQFFDAAFQMRIMPAHWLAPVNRADYRTSEVIRSPVGSGQFRFARWDKGALVEIVADTAHYRGRPKLDRLIWSIAPDFTTAVTKLFTGEADMLEYLRPDNVREIGKHPQLTMTKYGSLDYGMMLFNLRDARSAGQPHPLFGDPGMRRALTMAIDRKRIVQNVLDSLGVVAIGPFTRAYTTADTTLAQISHDLDGAKRVLDSLGWTDVNGDGVREKNGRPLRFALIAPTSSTNRIRMSVLLQEMLKQVGAVVDLEHLELNAFAEKLNSKHFDAALQAWRLDPSPASIRQTWGTSAARAKDGSNYSSYQSRTFDALIDSAVVEMNPAKAKAYYRRAYETIIADAPAVWLYEPVNFAGHHRRIRPAFMRADAWWTRIGDWTIPPNERIRRDSIGLRPKTE